MTATPGASSSPLTDAAQSRPLDSRGGGSTDSAIPLALGGILLLGLLAGILTFVLLGWRRGR